MRAAAFDVQGLNALRNTTRAKTPEGVKESARQFEGLLLQSMLKSMRATVPQNNFLGSDAEKMYTDLLDQQLAQTLANQKNGLGFAKSIEKNLARQMGVELSSQKPENDLEKKTALPAEKTAFPTLNIFSEEFRASPSSKNKVETQNLTPSTQTSALSFSPLFEVESYLQKPSAPLEKKSAFTVEKTDWKTTPAELNAKAALSSLQTEKNLPEHAQNFIQSVWENAQSAAKESGLNPLHIVAHAALESGWGQFQPGGKKNPSFNLFGIKADENWAGKRVLAKTTEFENGKAQQKYAAFRAYDSYTEAFLDYVDFLQNNPRYASVFHAQNAKDFAEDLQKSGYATDPRYALKLQRAIERTEAFLRS